MAAICKNAPSSWLRTNPAKQNGEEGAMAEDVSDMQQASSRNDQELQQSSRKKQLNNNSPSADQQETRRLETANTENDNAVMTTALDILAYLETWQVICSY